MKHSKHPYPICWLIGPLWVHPQLQELHGMEGRAPEEDGCWKRVDREMNSFMSVNSLWANGKIWKNASTQLIIYIYILFWGKEYLWRCAMDIGETDEIGWTWKNMSNMNEQTWLHYRCRKPVNIGDLRRLTCKLVVGCWMTIWTSWQ